MLLTALLQPVGEALVHLVRCDARTDGRTDQIDVAQPVPLLHARVEHSHPDQQSVGIDGDDAFDPLRLLAGVVATVPPFSVALTDWDSITTARGSGSRPARSGTCRRRRSSARSQVPSSV